ncbi:MAG TPA: prolyl oligopeptidase family serine peptidase [Clostridiaceae bacterium]|nr:prolyl oligopeptidase family serine peptidase [Clostridiaceae bacterium]
MNLNDLNKLSINSVIPYNENQLETYIDLLTKKNLDKGDKVRASIKTAEDLEQHRHRIRESFLRAIGGLPPMGDVKVTVTKTHVTEGLICENIVLETLPNFYATANVYKPEDAKGVLPAVLMVCGHSALGRMYEVYQRVQRRIAKAGFVVMGLDPIGQGERISYLEEGQKELAVGPCTLEHEYAGIQCLLTGLTITRYFVHDGICALNYLASREDVDEMRIGVTGSSGGGTQTAMLMMTVPEKIAAAAPGTFITDRMAILYSRAPQDLEQIWPGMAADGFDHADILACMAPKPVLLLTDDSDFFPLEGVERTIKKAKPLWDLFGKGEALEIFTDKSKHAYTWNLANAAADFFSRALKGTPSKFMEYISTSDPKDLYATESGNVVKSLNSKIIHDFVLDELKAIDAKNSELSSEERRENAKKFVYEQVNNYEPYPLYIKRSYDEVSVLNMNMELFTWFQQEGILNFGALLKSPGTNPGKIVIAAWEGGVSMLHCNLDLVMKYCEKGYGVFVIDLVGTGSHSNNYYKEYEPDYFHTRFSTFANNLLVNGDNIVAMRVRGICRALDALEKIMGKENNKEDNAENIEFGIITKGKYNLYALMTKLIDNRIKFVDEYEPLESVRYIAERKYYNNHNIKAIVMPGMLRYFDIDDLRRGFI